MLRFGRSRGSPAGRLAALALAASLAVGCAGPGSPPAGPSTSGSFPGSPGQSPATASTPPSGPRGTPGDPGALPTPDIVYPAETCGPNEVCRAVAVERREGLPLSAEVPCGERPDQACILRFDRFSPVGVDPRAVAVILPGGPDHPRGYGYPRSLAALLAGQGVEVIVAAWRHGGPFGAAFPGNLGDVGCAVRTARSLLDEAPGHVTLVGHSLGAWGGAVAVLHPELAEPTPGSCIVTAGSAEADAFVGLAGPYAELGDERRATTWEWVLGGTAASAPGAWAAADPLAALADLEPRDTSIALLHGGADREVEPGDTRRFADALTAAGWRVATAEPPLVDHDGILTEPATIAAILDTLPR